MVHAIRTPFCVGLAWRFAWYGSHRFWRRLLRKEFPMKIQTLIIYLLIVLLAAPAAMGKQRNEPPETWRAFAERLEAGAFVRVRLLDHHQVKGYFIVSDGEILRIKPKTRVPVPIRDLQFANIE